MVKRAVQRLVRGDDGRTKVILIDLDTFQEVLDPTGYQIISPANPVQEPVASVDEPNEDSSSDIQNETETRRDEGRGSPNYTRPDNSQPNSPRSQTQIQGAPTGQVTRGGPIGPATPANNLQRNPYEGSSNTGVATSETTNPNGPNRNGRGLANLVGNDLDAPNTSGGLNYGGIQNNSPHRNNGDVRFGLTDEANRGMSAMAAQSPSGIAIK